MLPERWLHRGADIAQGRLGLSAPQVATPSGVPKPSSHALHQYRLACLLIRHYALRRRLMTGVRRAITSRSGQRRCFDSLKARSAMMPVKSCRRRHRCRLRR